ncbi:glycogen debranching enzyme N-terminal domain-containing protein [Plectonema cf. radiosum LEGE 06105]|uniref:Glycogen debranching enzyme N-terminal domain-containing protein n=1 Tax=Plectonema cf. radiosum LEGE 06105 TaxID=945769 RepID=A0A8J7JSX5_9CYAN|nr:amylo-alpha-1,6-glucosidase [Plectonema radiosum]MBE9213059.1 glycogen debranching enzyme N-terminal domain-containing protein [Plectonema cf. radiosum LEGE 06105]
MGDLDIREWLLTNGLGSFASGTVCDVRTRSYHGWLFAATNPPSGRTLLMSHLEASLELADGVMALGNNFWASGEIEPQGYKLLRSFEINPIPQWIWGEQHWQLSREILMPYGLEAEVEADSLKVPDQKAFSHRVLIKYCYEGKDAAVLKLRLLIGDRDFHHQQKYSSQLEFWQLGEKEQLCLQANNGGELGIPWHLRWSKGSYESSGMWYWNYGLPEETRRGLADKEDLYSPGYLSIFLEPGDTVTVEAKLGVPDESNVALDWETFNREVLVEQKRLSQIFGWEIKDKETRGENLRGGVSWVEESVRRQQDKVENSSSSSLLPSKSVIWEKLLRASDQFIVYRASIAGPTAIAGYHWFNDWGRDTLIALPGLTIVTGRFEIAKGLLRTFGHYCRQGLIPNAFPDVGGEPFYNSIDATLWWIETLGIYLEATQDWQFLAEQYPIIRNIYKAFVGGTNYKINVDSTDGLLSWDASGVALTWMDAVVEGVPVTPRRGKPVEINALWYSALCWASRWAEVLSEQANDREGVVLAKQAQRYTQQAQQVKKSLQKFWNPKAAYLYDTIEPDDRRNSQIRPNAVLALSLSHCGFSAQQGYQVLERASKTLLTPYGLRSLEPSDPEYTGKYTGDSATRDRAYHQGTVWSWLIGPFIRAWQRFHKNEPLPFDWEPLMHHFLLDGCIGSISEIFDGDQPHAPKGAVAQAWSVAEVIRHYKDEVKS